MLFIIIISVIILYFLLNEKLDLFTIVGYNSNNFVNDKIQTSFEIETSKLIKIFNTKFPENNDTFDIKNYSLYGNYITFEFNDIIKKALAEYIRRYIIDDNFSIELVSDLTDIFWKDIDNDRLYIFNINIIMRSPNNSKSILHNIKVKIKVKNIHLNIKNNNIKNAIEILAIKLNVATNPRSVSGIDNLQAKYYQISNKLHLTDF